jgi:hypothetical protein
MQHEKHCTHTTGVHSRSNGREIFFNGRTVKKEKMRLVLPTRESAYLLLLLRSALAGREEHMLTNY